MGLLIFLPLKVGGVFEREGLIEDSRYFKHRLISEPPIPPLRISVLRLKKEEKGEKPRTLSIGKQSAPER